MGGVCLQLTIAGVLVAVCASQSMEVWLTTGDQSKKLSRESDIPGSSSPGSGINILVDPSSQGGQAMLGFGAGVSNAAAYLLYNTPQRGALLGRLFDSNDGIGLNYIRLVMGGSDFNAVNPYTYNDIPTDQTDFNLDRFSIEADRQFVIPLLKEILQVNPNVKIMASPWSAPAWMKTTRSLNGGELRNGNQYIDTLANYFVRFIQAYQDEGISIDTITLQNEPRHSSGSYPTMLMSPDTQAAVIKVAGPLFIQNNINTQIVAWDHNWDGTDYVLDVYRDSQAFQYINGSAFHCYGGDKSDPQIVRNAYPTKDIYFTECSGGEWDTNFASSFIYNVETLLIGQTWVGARTVLLWNMALDENHGPRVGVTGGCSNCRGVVTVKQDGSWEENLEYFALGHFSKFLQRGAVHIGSTRNSDWVETVAFRNPDGSIVTIVANTNWNDPRTVQIQMEGIYYRFVNLNPRSVLTLIRR